MAKAPQQRRDRHVEHGELVAQHELLLGEHRRDLRQRVAYHLAAFFGLFLRALFDGMDVAEHFILEAVQEQPRTRTQHRIGRHQLRMRKTVVDVFVDDIRLIQNEIALDQHRHLVVRIHHCEVFGLVVKIDIDDLEIHAFFVEHDAATLAEGAGGARI